MTRHVPSVLTPDLDGPLMVTLHAVKADTVTCSWYAELQVVLLHLQKHWSLPVLNSSSRPLPDKTESFYMQTLQESMVAKPVVKKMGIGSEYVTVCLYTGAITALFTQQHQSALQRITPSLHIQKTHYCINRLLLCPQAGVMSKASVFTDPSAHPEDPERVVGGRAPAEQRRVAYVVVAEIQKQWDVVALCCLTRRLSPGLATSTAQQVQLLHSPVYLQGTRRAKSQRGEILIVSMKRNKHIWIHKVLWALVHHRAGVPTGILDPMKRHITGPHHPSYNHTSETHPPIQSFK